MDMLKKSVPSAAGTTVKLEVKGSGSRAQETWLSGGFMMGAKMKDWDKDEGECGASADEVDLEDNDDDELGMCWYGTFLAVVCFIVIVNGFVTGWFILNSNRGRMIRVVC